jgi:hypothetical protein
MHSYTALESIAHQRRAALAAEAELHRLGRPARRRRRAVAHRGWLHHLPREPLMSARA